DTIKRELADGSKADAQLWVATFAIFPGFEMKHWFDQSHQIVGLAYDIDAMAFDSRLADASVSGMTFGPPEMSGLSVVVPDRPIKDINRQKKIVYELSYDAGDLDTVPKASVMQSVESLGKGKARVTVDLGAKPQAADEDRPSEKHLANSIMIDHEDKLVRELARQATAKLKGDASKLQIASACKRFVTAHISGASLSVGDGSASEAARTREGDCTECSVLLAALLRVHGIPSRCVNGLVYTEDDFVGQDNVFVYHMWTQAWIEQDDGKGYWLDLDSAMWRYSAGHIMLGVSAMGDDDQQDQIKIVPMQQGLQIKVIETKKR
ncbi:MAG: transglutaminase family protein, partial [Phycisphaeraceae bacterium]